MDKIQNKGSSMNEIDVLESNLLVKANQKDKIMMCH
jgi:hypothetical protein